MRISGEYRAIPHFYLINALVYVVKDQSNHEVFLSRTNCLFLNYDPKKQTILKPEWSCFCFSSVPQIRWEWKRAFLRIWKLPTKIFHHIKKRKSYSCNFSWCIFVTRQISKEIHKKTNKVALFPKKNFFMTCFWHLKSTFQNLYIGVVKGSLWCYQNLLKKDSMMKFSMLKSWKTNTSQDSSFFIFCSPKGLT